MTAQEPVNRTTLEMMRHAVSHAGRNYYCAERHTQEWGAWSGLVVLGLAQFGNLINDGCDQYFHVTDAGIEYLRKVGADAMTAPIDTSLLDAITTHPGWDPNLFEDAIRCPHCAEVDHEYTDYPTALRHDGDKASYRCDACGADFTVRMCVEYTYASAPEKEEDALASIRAGAEIGGAG